MAWILCGLVMLTLPPMLYSNNSDLTDSIDQKVIMQLVDDEGINLNSIAELQEVAGTEYHTYAAVAQLQLQRIEKARVRANELIKTWLRGHIPDEGNDTLKHTEVDLTIYYLYSRRMRADMPDGISEGYKRSIDTLRELQKGITKAADNTKTATAKMKSNKSAGDRIFTHDKLKGYG